MITTLPYQPHDYESVKGDDTPPKFLGICLKETLKNPASGDGVR